MDRKLLKIQFTKNRIPAWFCPNCRSGILHPKKDGFLFYETADSKKSHNHGDWDPEWVDYNYSLILECSNKSCRETVSSSGIGFVSVEQDYDSVTGYPDLSYIETFAPKYFYPPLRLFDFPEEVAEDVKNEFKQSFELFYCNPSSSANHIRIALERLLNHFKIKRFETNEGKKIFLSLHKRIELTSNKFPSLKEYFLALKWLGNAGSHSNSNISMDDVIDAYEIFEFVLNDLFKSKSVKRIVKEINKRKGPTRKKL